MTLDTSERWLTRFAVQQIVLQAMEDLKLDAMITPTGNIPPYILGRPLEPTLNGRGPSIWSFLGTQGFPQLGVPAGFTTRSTDRIRDSAAPGRHASDRSDAAEASAVGDVLRSSISASRCSSVSPRPTSRRRITASRHRTSVR
jgi:hypothetical protein